MSLGTHTSVGNVTFLFALLQILSYFTQKANGQHVFDPIHGYTVPQSINSCNTPNCSVIKYCGQNDFQGDGCLNPSFSILLYKTGRQEVRIQNTFVKECLPQDECRPNDIFLCLENYQNLNATGSNPDNVTVTIQSTSQQSCTGSDGSYVKVIIAVSCQKCPSGMVWRDCARCSNTCNTPDKNCDVCDSNTTTAERLGPRCFCLSPNVLNSANECVPQTSCITDVPSATPTLAPTDAPTDAPTTAPTTVTIQKILSSVPSNIVLNPYWADLAFQKTRFGLRFRTRNDIPTLILKNATCYVSGLRSYSFMIAWLFNSTTMLAQSLGQGGSELVEEYHFTFPDSPQITGDNEYFIEFWLLNIFERVKVRAQNDTNVDITYSSDSIATVANVTVGDGLPFPPVPSQDTCNFHYIMSFGFDCLSNQQA